MKKTIKKLVIIAIWLGIWQLASVATGLELLLASPVQVVAALFKLVLTKKFWLVVGNSFFKIMTGFLVAFATGIIVGAFAGSVKIIKEFLEPVIQMMKALPVAAFIILVLIWFGSGNVAIIISLIVVFPMIYTAVVEGIQNVDRSLLEMAEVFHVHFWKKVIYIYMPQIYPYIVTNLKTALGMCWKAGISAEVIGLAGNSIGSQMYYSKLYLMTAELFAWSIMVVLVSYLFENVFLWIMSAIKKRIESI